MDEDTKLGIAVPLGHGAGVDEASQECRDPEKAYFGTNLSAIGIRRSSTAAEALAITKHSSARTTCMPVFRVKLEITQPASVVPPLQTQYLCKIYFVKIVSKSERFAYNICEV